MQLWMVATMERDRTPSLRSIRVPASSVLLTTLKRTEMSQNIVLRFPRTKTWFVWLLPKKKIPPDLLCPRARRLSNSRHLSSSISQLISTVIKDRTLGSINNLLLKKKEARRSKRQNRMILKSHPQNFQPDRRAPLWLKSKFFLLFLF